MDGPRDANEWRWGGEGEGGSCWMREDDVLARESSRVYAKNGARGRNGMTKLVRESYLSTFDIINQFSVFPRCFPTYLFTSHSGKTVQPGCNQPFPNWTAFHVEALAIRMRVCFTGIFISAALRRDGRSSIRGVPTPATPIHAAAVTVSYAKGRRRIHRE